MLVLGHKIMQLALNQFLILQIQPVVTLKLSDEMVSQYSKKVSMLYWQNVLWMSI